MINLSKSLLVIAPHPDDEVIGCAGLIQRVKRSGGKVYVLYLTVAATKDFSPRGHSTMRERTKEIKQVAALLQVDGWHLAWPGPRFHLRLDHLPQQTLIHTIERGNRISLEGIKPDIVAFPALADYNQDHRAAASAALTACRPAPPAHKFIPPLVLAYESPMNTWLHTATAPLPNFFLTLTSKTMATKVEAMRRYASQSREATHPRNGDTLQALATVRGSSVGTAFAEAYFCHKLTLS